MGNTEASLRLENLELDKLNGKVHEDWNVYPGKLNGLSVTVFSAVHPQSSCKRPFIEKALQASKIYRHPGILRYIDGGILGKEVLLVTEEAVPLQIYGLDHMSSLQITAGLASVIDALQFLHEKAGVSHNNVCSASIYITPEGMWKLWGFEYLCSFGDLTRDQIEKINPYCCKKYIPPDDKNGISSAYQHARDCYALAKFIEDIISPPITVGIPYYDEFLAFVRTKCMHKEWSKRPRLSTFTEHSLFQHEFLQLRHDVTNILLLPSEKRDQFISSLPGILRKYSDDAVASTFGTFLLSHSFLLIPSTANYLMPCILIPKSSSESGIFSDGVFKKIIVPMILQLFAVHDAAIRKILLTYFKHYAHFIPKDLLTKDVLPQLLLGIRDTDEILVSSTLHCLAYLIPLLGADTVIGRNREQIFATAKPKPSLELKNIKEMSRRRESLSLPLNETDPILIQEEGTIDIFNCEAFPFDSTSSSSQIFSEICERKAPDGGEMTDEDVFRNEIQLDENPAEEVRCGEWSDWEDVNDKHLPDIVGILQIKTSENENAPFVKTENESEVVNNDIFIANVLIPKSKPARHSLHASHKTKGNSGLSTQLHSEVNAAKGSAMKLKAKATPRAVSQGLGEEYDIMSIKIKKKPDKELDLFADLMPNLDTKSYDLEAELIEANLKKRGREKIPSLSDTLAELGLGGEEGNDWCTEESDWTSEDQSLLSVSSVKESEDIVRNESKDLFQNTKQLFPLDHNVSDNLTVSELNYSKTKPILLETNYNDVKNENDWGSDNWG